MQGFENMLPWTNGMRPANAHRLTREKATDKIRKKPIRRPVASANHIAGTGSSNTNPVLG
jgi:hypothetical protein